MAIMLHIYKLTAKNTQTNVDCFIRRRLKNIDYIPDTNAYYADKLLW